MRLKCDYRKKCSFLYHGILTLYKNSVEKCIIRKRVLLIYLSLLCLYICLPIYFLYVYLYTVYISNHLSIYLDLYLSVFLSIDVGVYLYAKHIQGFNRQHWFCKTIKEFYFERLLRNQRLVASDSELFTLPFYPKLAIYVQDNNNGDTKD